MVRVRATSDIPVHTERMVRGRKLKNNDSSSDSEENIAAPKPLPYDTTIYPSFEKMYHNGKLYYRDNSGMAIFDEKFKIAGIYNNYIDGYNIRYEYYF